MANTLTNINYGTFEKEVLSQKIAARLLSLIREKQLHPGDRLPPERELAVSMHVSRPSLREALRALSIMGIIENRQGSGTYVASLEPARLVEHLDLIFSLEDSTYLDLLQARRVVEVGLSAMAAIRITPEEITDLEACLERSGRSIDNPEEFLQCDLEIHERIAEAARNKILSILMASISKLSVYSRHRTGEDPEMRNLTYTDHRAIITAIKKRDPQAASRAMERHLDHVEEKLKVLSQTEELTDG
ncbi:MAG: FadR family transcriptional regulator [Chloroflexi bacterium]|nr:FadR family transcriptional regulator [Chloroflexota bacterium]